MERRCALRVSVFMFMFMFMSRGARSGTSLTIHPARIAVRVMLLLPDRHAVFHFIDDVAACGEGLRTMACADTHPHSHVADVKISDPVHAQRVLDTKSLDGFRDNPLTLFHGQWLECLVLEVTDGVTLIVVADPALETRVAPCGWIEQPGAQRGSIDLLAGEAEHAPRSDRRGRG